MKMDNNLHEATNQSSIHLYAKFNLTYTTIVSNDTIWLKKPLCHLCGSSFYSLPLDIQIASIIVIPGRHGGHPDTFVCPRNAEDLSPLPTEPSRAEWTIGLSPHRSFNSQIICKAQDRYDIFDDVAIRLPSLLLNVE